VEILRAPGSPGGGLASPLLVREGVPLPFPLRANPGSDLLVVAPELFRKTSRSALCQSSLVGLSLGSSALRSCRLSPAFFATMASADSCPALTVQVSPSKVFKLSTRFVRLYLLLLSVTLGFRVC